MIAAACAALLSLAVASCGGDDPENQDDGVKQSLDLVIGNLVPLSGELARFGPAGAKSANLAAAQIGAAIRSTGADHTVRVINRDEGRTPEAAARAARRLVDLGGASCITGPWASAATIAVADSVAIPDGVLLISPASTADEITSLDDEGLVNRTIAPDAAEGATLADQIAQDLGDAEGRTVNIGARDDDYGDRIAESFQDEWEELGGAVGEHVTYDPEQPAFAGEAADITEGDPDAYVIIDFPETFAKLAPALQRTGEWDPSRAWGTAALGLPGLAAATGADAIEGMRGITPGVPDQEEASSGFARSFAQAPPRAVRRDRFDAQTFDAVVLCYLAAVEARSTEGGEMADALIDLTAPGGAGLSWQQLPALIGALGAGEDVDYRGASGEIDMDISGDATAGTYDVYRFRDGRIEVIGEVPVSTNE